MPYMRISTAEKLTEEKKAELVEKLGIALEEVPGKKRNMLMAEINDGVTFYFLQAKEEKFCFLDVRWFGKFEYHIKNSFTKKAFEAVRDVLDIPFNKISMNIGEVTTWGGFGRLNDMYYKDPEDTKE